MSDVTKHPASGQVPGGLSQPTFSRVLLVLASVVVVMIGMRLAAPVLNPILFAVVLSLLLAPLYGRLRSRGIPTPLALVIMLIGLALLFAALFYILGASISRFSASIGYYSSQLNESLNIVEGLLRRVGISGVNIQDVLQPRALTGFVGTVLSGVAGFLSNLFLIFMIVLFLLAEGPALMNRLRAGTRTDHPQVRRLAIVGESVVKQFGLRALLNLVISTGITVFLLVMGVDFALMWGILTFFMGFVPYIGLVLAVAPAVLLTLAEFDIERALIVIVGVTVINLLGENVLSPMLMSRGLKLSPTIVFLSFVLWTWLLGGPGAFLAVPLTFFVAVMLDTFPETRWISNLIGVSKPPENEGLPEPSPQPAEG